MERDTPSSASPPDPPQDQPGQTTPVPEYIAAVLHAVSILLGYGRHLLATVRQRAASPTFPIIAACFGTANLSTILAHLDRGILRAAAPRRTRGCFRAAPRPSITHSISTYRRCRHRITGGAAAQSPSACSACIDFLHLR
jgi:hypothetical protein